MSRPARRRRPHLLGELVVVLCLLLVYDLVRASASVRRTSAVEHGDALLRAERLLLLDVERSANTWTTGHHWLSLVASDVYQYAHGSVTLGVLLICWVRCPEQYRSARNALVLINLVGLAVFFLYPVAPPRLLPDAGFVDAVALAGFGTTHDGPVAADQYGALPSLHLAWAVWSAVVAAQLLATRRARWRLAAYPALVTVVVVVTGNHYLLDAVAGTAVALVALRVTRARDQREPAAGSGAGLLQDADGPGDDEQGQDQGGHGLEGHEQLGPAEQRHRVGRAEG